MKDSWQAGIPDKDKTELVTTGIYRFSRNPAFLGFDLMYVGCPAAVRKPADTRLFCLCHRHAPLADIAGGKIPCEHLWRAVSGVLPPCVPVFGQKIKTFSGEQIMSKRTRQYIGILAALAAYYLVHEGAHLLYALLSGVFKQINFMGLGVQIDVYAEHMTNMQLGIFCLVGALATFCVGYLLAALARCICQKQAASCSALLHNDCFFTARPALLEHPVRLFRRRGYERHRLSLPRVGGKVPFRCVAPCKWVGILEADTACLPAIFFRAMNL